MPKSRRTKGSGTVRQLASGRFQAIMMHDGQRQARTFETKAGAQGWLNSQRQDITDGVWTPTPAAGGRAPTFAEYAPQWLARRNLKPRTRHDYQALIDAYLTPVWADVRLDRISVEDVEQWHAGLLPDAPTQRAHVYSLLRTMLTTAYQKDVIPANPCRVPGAGSAKRASATEIPTVAQVAALATAMTSTKYRLMVLMAAWCGLRYGELTELRGADIIDGRVKVSRAVSRVGGQYIVGDTKSEAGVRTVAVPSFIREELDDFVAGVAAGALLFPSSRGNSHMAPSAFYKVYYPARDSVGLPDLRFHDLRHFQGTMYAQTGATLAEIQGRLGHSTVQAAMRYQGIAQGRDAELTERMVALASK